MRLTCIRSRDMVCMSQARLWRICQNVKCDHRPSRANQIAFLEGGIMTIDSNGLSRWDLIIIDSCCFMESDEGCDKLLGSLKDSGVAVIIPFIVRREIDKHLAGQDDEKRGKAKRASHIISRYIADGVGKEVDLQGGMDEKNTHADQEIAAYVELKRKGHDILILTEDRDFAGEMLRRKSSRHSKSSRHLDIALVKGDGNLEFWQNAKCIDCGDFMAAQDSRVAKYGEKLRCSACTKILVERKNAGANATSTSSANMTNDDQRRWHAVGIAAMNKANNPSGNNTRTVESSVDMKRVLLIGGGLLAAAAAVFYYANRDLRW